MNQLKAFLMIFTLMMTNPVWADSQAPHHYELNEIQPLIQKYCVRCHNDKKHEGDFNITVFKTKKEIRFGRKEWLRVLHQLESEEMPPDEPLPTDEERAQMIDWVNRATYIDWSKVKNPGHVTIPRLTKDEYNNTMRDLLGIDLQPGAFLSEDGEGLNGFNTDRDGLFITPSLMEKYLAAAETSLSTIIAYSQGPQTIRHESEKMFMTETKETPKNIGDDFFGYIINRGQMTLYESVTFPADGYYDFRVRAVATGSHSGMALRVNDQLMKKTYVSAGQPEVYTIRLFVKAGSHQVAWNIEKNVKQPIATTKPKELEKPQGSVSQKYVRPKKIRKLPKTANTIVTREAQKRAPKFTLSAIDVSAQAQKAAEALNSASYNLQRPYEWLRLLKTDGDPNEILRFKGYIQDRVRAEIAAEKKLADATGVTHEELSKEFRKQNKEQFADRLALLKRVENVTSAAVRKSPGSKSGKVGNVAIDWIEVTGPYASKDNDQNTQKVFISFPTDKSNHREIAIETISRFAERAFRRPVRNQELDKFIRLYDLSYGQNPDFTQSVKMALTGVLVSPNFLFRVELGKPTKESKIDDFQLASRLSYFIWMSMPDEELFKLAKQGLLHQPEILNQQVQRMVQDPKADAFYDAFLGQWLGFSSLGKTVMPDPKKFPTFTTELAEDMKKETQIFFQQLVRENRSVFDLLASDYSFINQRLANHYGIKQKHTSEFQKVVYTDGNRGGLLGMGSILVATSNPTRTSPVIRGKWVAETLLGEKVPEPPADAGELDTNAGEASGRTLREELLIHRRNPSCAACHDKIDPIGFGLENFDATGKYRTKEGRKNVDNTGTFPDGTSFQGSKEMKSVLLKKRSDDFSEKLDRENAQFCPRKKT